MLLRSGKCSWGDVGRYIPRGASSRSASEKWPYSIAVPGIHVCRWPWRTAVFIGGDRVSESERDSPTHDRSAPSETVTWTTLYARTFFFEGTAPSSSFRFELFFALKACREALQQFASTGSCYAGAGWDDALDVDGGKRTESGLLDSCAPVARC